MGSDTGPNQNTSLAEHIALALGGVEREDRPGSWTACCPAHDDSKPSLSITNGDGGRPLLYCHAGCDYEDVRAALEARSILAEGWQDNLPPAAPRPPPKPPEPNTKALQIWQAASLVKAGGIVDRYLKGRGLTLNAPPTLHETQLRIKRLGRWHTVPAMLVLIQIPIEGESKGKPLTIQKTLLQVRQDGSVYRGDRLNATGSLGNAAVRLAKAGEILGLAEGVETALSAMQLTGIPCWACLGAQRMPRVAIPECVRELHIFGDEDVPGRKAARETFDAHCNRIKAQQHFPPQGFDDWNAALVGYYRPLGLNDHNDIARHAAESAA
jgi:putative DNA primase/helicase